MRIPIGTMTMRALWPPGLAIACAGILFAVTSCDVHSPTAGTTLSSITVSPNATIGVNTGQQFNAIGHDGSGTVVAISPAWSVVAGGGTINSTGMFTSGTVTGTFTKTVQATSGGIAGFATVIVTAVAPPANLGTAATYGILAGSAVTCAGAPGTINADVGISPGSGSTGFPPCTITGAQHYADATSATAQNDLTTAYNALAGKPCGTTVTPADVGGRTLTPGVYCVASTLGVTGTVTLDGQGDPNAVFLFQVGSSLTTGTTANIALSNGTQAKNVWWQVGASATLGTGTTFRGNIVALTSITLVDNATMLGRALARNGAVALGTNNTITLP